MLDLLIERFDEHFVTPIDNEMITECLDEEFRALTDVDHLERNVIGKPLFEWDYDVLGDGFLQLVAPYMKKHSRIPFLFLHALRDLDADKREYRKAIVLLEYSHYASLINDHYTFHEDLASETQDLSRYSKLTQVRYAGQYLQMYPRYLLVTNAFGVDNATLFDLHRLLTQMSILAGASRGVLLKWSHSCFNKMSPENYLQNAVGALSHYILFPILLASVLSRAGNDAIRAIRKAFSYFTVFAKLRCEKRLRLDQLDPDLGEYERSASIPILLEGFGFSKSGLKIDEASFSNGRFPNVMALKDEVSRRLRETSGPELVGEIAKEEKSSFDRFREQLNEVGLLRGTASVLSQCFDM